MKKPEISLSQMEPTQLYKNLDDQKLYRRLSTDNLETMENGTWRKVRITKDFLLSGRFHCVSNDRKKPKKKK